MPAVTSFKDRMDITGARWSVAGAEAVLKLRALRAKHDFPAYWRFHLTESYNESTSLATPTTSSRRLRVSLEKIRTHQKRLYAMRQELTTLNDERPATPDALDVSLVPT